MSRQQISSYSIKMTDNFDAKNIYVKEIQKMMKPIKFSLNNFDHKQYFQTLKGMDKEKSQLTFQSNKKTLFIDLDETLIHTIDSSKESYHYKLKINIPRQNQQKTLKQVTVRFKVRSYCFEFLENVSKLCDIILFTASRQQYAQGFYKFLNQKTNGSIKQVLSRKSCIPVKNKFSFKDPRMFSQLNQKNFLVIDNSLSCFFPVLQNGILVSSFINNQNDDQLIALIEHISIAVKQQDIRTFTRTKYGLLQIFNNT